MSRCPPQELACQACLADACFACEEHDLGVTELRRTAFTLRMESHTTTNVDKWQA